MYRKLQKKVTNKKGFTLIELIVVIAIIAILAAVLIPRFAGFTESGRKSAAISNARNILVAVQAMDSEGETLADIDSSDITSYAGSDFFTNSSSINTITRATTGTKTGVDFEYTYKTTGSSKSYIVSVVDGVLDTTWDDSSSPSGTYVS